MPAIFHNIAGSTYYLGIQSWDRFVLNLASFRACPGSPLSQQNQQHVPMHALLGARVQKIKNRKSGITLTPAQSQAPGLIHSSNSSLRLANPQASALVSRKTAGGTKSAGPCDKTRKSERSRENGGSHVFSPVCSTAWFQQPVLFCHNHSSHRQTGSTTRLGFRPKGFTIHRFLSTSCQQ